MYSNKLKIKAKAFANIFLQRHTQIMCCEFCGSTRIKRLHGSTNVCGNRRDYHGSFICQNCGAICAETLQVWNKESLK